MKIGVSILAGDFRNLEECVSQVESAGADALHLDIMDGNFVPNLALGFHDVEALSKLTRLPMDAHLMIQRPLDYWERFADLGVKTITAHLETLDHPAQFVDAVRKKGFKAGLTGRPAWDLASSVEQGLEADLFLQMSVEPGFYGQSFLGQSPARLEALRKALDQNGSTAELQVDGGINQGTIGPALKAGADHFVVGSAAFKGKGPSECLPSLRKAAGEPK